MATDVLVCPRCKKPNCDYIPVGVWMFNRGDERYNDFKKLAEAVA